MTTLVPMAIHLTPEVLVTLRDAAASHRNWMMVKRRVWEQKTGHKRQQENLAAVDRLLRRAVEAERIVDGWYWQSHQLWKDENE